MGGLARRQEIVQPTTNDVALEPCGLNEPEKAALRSGRHTAGENTCGGAGGLREYTARHARDERGVLAVRLYMAHQLAGGMV